MEVDERLAPDFMRDPLHRAQEPNPTDGSFTYSYPLRVAPGRNGIQPNLALSYNSGSGGIHDIFGVGWSVNIPYIQLTNRQGLDSTYAGSSTPFFLSSEDGELATTTAATTTSYAARFDNGDFRQYTYSTSTGWLVKDKNGLIYKYGTTTAARQDKPGDTSKIFKWMLEEVRDANGNYMYYKYTKDKGQIYPSKVTYTHNATSTGIFEIEFLTEAQTTASSSMLGFAVATAYRIYEIQVKINGAWVTKYSLGYTTGDNTARSLLSSIQETGRDESGTELSRPATTFGYQTLQSAQRAWSYTGLGSAENFTTGTNDRGTRLGEANGDGLVDFLRYDNLADISEKKVYTSTGGGWVYDANLNIPNESTFGNGSVDTGTRLLDVDADGLIDIVRAGWGTSTVYINKGDGTGWSASSSWVLPVSFTNLNGTTDYGVRFGDVNGDGLIDMVQALNGSSTGSNVYINSGNSTGWARVATYSLPPGGVYFTNGTIDENNRLEDLNADGFADIVHGGGSVYMNKGDGTGWTLDTSWGTTPLSFADGAGSDLGTRLVDINGDNLSDLVRMYVDSGGTTTARYINTNPGWSSSSDWSLPVPFVHNSYPDAGVRLADANGDGLVDLLRGLSGVDSNVYVNQAEVVDLLTTVRESSGGRTSVAYKGSSEQNRQTGLPFTLQTVSSITKDDGYGTVGTTTYSYSGGDYYFKNQLDRRSAGFEIVARTDPVGNIAKTFYHQGNTSSTTKGEYDDHISKVGKPFRVEKYDSTGSLLAKTISKWDRIDLGGNDRSFVKLVQSVDFAYDGDSDHRELATSYTYNATGSIIGKVAWGEVSGNDDGTFTDTGTDLASTSISYVASTTGFLMVPSQETIRDSSGTKVKETVFYYDKNAASSTAPTRGNVTRTAQWKSGTSYASSSKAYTPFGLVSEESDPRGGTTTYRYDQYQLYGATSTNPLSQATNFYYDYSLGKPATTTDPNSRNFVTVYDGLDRIKEIKEPDPNSPTSLLRKTANTYTDSGSRNIKETQYLTSATSTDRYRYLDGFDRVIQERNLAEESNIYAVRDFTYDRRGLLASESIPYFATGSATTTATTSVAALTSYYYDALQRMASTSNVFGVTTNSYDDWRATTTDPLSHAKAIEKDAFGNITRVNEVNSTSTYSTDYTYDRLSNLTKITDALGNVRNFTYDGLSRRLTAADLHASADAIYGTWTFTYDDAGNVSSQVDPKSQTVNFTYDKLNRLLNEDYTGQTGKEIVYIYDNCTEGIGRLCSASTTVATSTFTYYANGLKRTEAQRIGTTTATTTFAYDRQGNVIDITYPDSASTHYSYNNAGFVETISHRERGVSATTTLVEDIDYGPHGKPTFMDFFNDTVSTSTYNMNAAWRLTSKTTVGNVVHGMSWAAPLYKLLGLGRFFLPRSFLPYARAQDFIDESSIESATDEVDVPADFATTSGQLVPMILEDLGISSTTAVDPSADEESAPGLIGSQNVEAVLEYRNEAIPVGNPADSQEVSPDAGVVNPTESGSVGKERSDLLSWNVMSATELPSGNIVSDIRVKQVRFLDAEEKFQPIDTRPVATAEGWNVTRNPFTAFFPLRSTGTAVFHNNNRFDIRAKSRVLEPALDHQITALDVADVAGIVGLRDFGFGQSEAVVYENAYSTPSADLAYVVHQGTVPRLRKIIQFKDKASLPDADFELRFKSCYSEPIEFFIDGEKQPANETIRTTKELIAKRSTGERMVVHEPFAIWDSSRSVNQQLIFFRVEPLGDNCYTLVKEIPRAFFDAATFPVYTDVTDTLYSSSSDCRAGRTGVNEAWSTIRGGAENTQSDTFAFDSVAGVRWSFPSGTQWTTILRSWFPFDTSSIPDTDTIIAATSSIKGQEVLDNATIDQSLSLVNGPTDCDYASFGTTQYDSSDIAWGSLSASSYNDFALNAAGLAAINKLGTTNLGYRTSGDRSGTEPAHPGAGISARDDFVGYYSEQGGTSEDPKLVIEHLPPPPSVTTTDATGVTTSSATLGGILNIGGYAEAGVLFNYGTTTDFTMTVPYTSSTTAETKTASTSFSAAISGLSRLNLYHVRAVATSTGNSDVYGGDKTFITADVSATATSSYDFDLGTHSNTATDSNDLVLSGSSGVWTSPALSLGALYAPGDSIIRWATTTPGGSSVTVKAAINSSGTTPPNATEFATSTNGGAIQGLTGYLSGKYLWIRVEMATSGATPRLHDYWLGVNNNPYYLLTSNNLQDFLYTYDAVGNVTRIIDASSALTSKISDYQYDNLYRLTLASTSAATTSTSNYLQLWSYNAIGNFATSSTQGTYSYAGTNYANPHAATTIGTSTITTLNYDANGNLASTTRGSTITRYGWDYRNQLTQVATGTATTTYGYAVSGNRVSVRPTGSGSTTYPNQYFNVQGATTTKHVFLNGELVATIVGNGVSTSTYIVHTDQLGGTSVITNASGTVVETTDYYAYGDQRFDQGSYSDQRKFTGKEYDASSGLTYFGARYQDGKRGTFLSEDPSFLAIGDPQQVRNTTGKDLPAYLSDPQSLNSYSYAGNNPIKNRDPNGKFFGVDDAVVISTSPLWVPVAAGVLYYSSQALYDASVNLAQRMDRGFYQRQIPDVGIPTPGEFKGDPKGPWGKIGVVTGLVIWAASEFYGPIRDAKDNLIEEWKKRMQGNQNTGHTTSNGAPVNYNSSNAGGNAARSTSSVMTEGRNGAGSVPGLPATVSQNGVTYYRNSSGLLSALPGK